VLAAVEKGAGLPLAAALELEAGLFGGVASGETAKNLIHVFFLKEAAKKFSVDAWFPDVGGSLPASGGAGGGQGLPPDSSGHPSVAKAMEDKKAPPTAPLRTIGIVGAGVMGSGIAQWCAMHGYGVILCDTSKEAIDRGVTFIRDLFADAVKRGRVTAGEAHRMTGGIGICLGLEDFEICDLVIEAIVEEVEAKQKVIANLCKVIGPDCVLASNTSALPIEELAATATNPGRVVGLHFFNPVSRMPLVELVLGPQTTRDAAERALTFARSLGKTPVVCKSAPGFLVTRVLFFYLNEACRLWEQGVPAEAMDRAMRDWGWPMGPMRLIDEVGVDVTDFIFGEMAHYFPGRFTVTGICGRMLAAGMKGRKNGDSTGFYDYAGGRETLNPAMAKFAPGATVTMDAKAIQDRLNGVMIEETRRVLAEGILKTADEADFALLMGAGFPAFRGGLMRYARASGMISG
jgi:3-hydroxyacyl-CoA dehydrogenase/enoyl-CoA hydratase/3-hydroxybutyryl-CoA epimerase